MKRNAIRNSPLLFHVCMLILLVLFFLYYGITRFLISKGISIITCPIHDILHIYCPLCGGSRAILAILRLDIKTAVLSNPPTVLFTAMFLFRYVKAWYGYIRTKIFKFSFPEALIWILLGIYILFFLIRNILLFANIDYLGDFFPNES